MKKILGILIIVLGVISGILFFKAGSNLSSEGGELKALRSVGGTSVAESYYQSMGEYGIAYATACYAFGLSIITISLGFGGRFLFDSLTLENSANHINTASLISCPNCGNPCSSEAKSCPKCGATISQDNPLSSLNI